MKKSDQVREFIKANPDAKAKDVATACGVTPAYVHSLKYVDRKKQTRKTKTVRKMAPAKPVTLGMLRSVTKELERDVYKHAMEELVASLREVIRDREAVIDYLEHKLEALQK